MSGNEEWRTVEGEIVEETETKTPEAPGRKTFFHPLSGVAILGIDWLAFGADAVTDFLLLVLVSLVAFAVTFLAVTAIQVRVAGDKPRTAYFKAFLGALAAGVPFPVTGTILGSAILVLSGLPLGRKK